MKIPEEMLEKCCPMLIRTAGHPFETKTCSDCQSCITRIFKPLAGYIDEPIPVCNEVDMPLNEVDIDNSRPSWCPWRDAVAYVDLEGNIIPILEKP